MTKKINPGKLFEHDFKESIPKDVYYVRIRDPILENRKTDPKEKKSYTFGERCPYDCILNYKSTQYCLELKSTGGTSIGYSGARPMIKAHQIEELARAARYPGIIAGLILNYRRIGRTWFIDIRDFQSYADASQRKSINPKDCALIGTEIPGTLMRVHWRYDISALWGGGQIGLEV